jgi:hypothetical protein
MGQGAGAGKGGPRRRKRERGKKRSIGPGAVGAWTEEELANLPTWEAPPEMATRDQEDAEALRKGIAIEGRRKRIGTRRLGNAEPYGEAEKEPRGGEEGERKQGGRGGRPPSASGRGSAR